MGKRILFVGAYPPPFGGIASHFEDLSEYFRKAGTDFFVFDFRTSPEDGKKEVDSPSVRLRVPHRLDARIVLYSLRRLAGIIRCMLILRPFIRRGSDLKYFLVRVVGICAAVEEFGIDTISTYHLYPEGVVGNAIKRTLFPRLRHALTVFGELQADTIGVGEFEAPYARALREADLLLASSLYCARGVEAVGINADKVAVVPYGVNLRHFRRLTEYSEELKRNTVLFVGQINERMGLRCLLDALRILVEEKNLPVTARIVGADHGYSSRLRQQISELCLEERITLHTGVSFKDLPAFYDSSYIYVNTMNTMLPCMGLSMKEAMGCELPVIASSAGGIPEAIEEGINGFIFRVDDPRHLAERIETLWNDPSLARRMGIAGRQLAGRAFDKDGSSARIVSLLEGL